MSDIPIEVRARDAASQEGCDGELFDLLIEMAAEIERLRTQLIETKAALENKEHAKKHLLLRAELAEAEITRLLDSRIRLARLAAEYRRQYLAAAQANAKIMEAVKEQERIEGNSEYTIEEYLVACDVTCKTVREELKR
jgi:hypothetical protein